MSDGYFWNKLEFQLDGKPITIGNTSVPLVVSASDASRAEQRTIANGANLQIYGSDYPNLGYLLVQSDMNTSAKIKDSDANEFYIGLRGTGTSGVFGPPLIIGREVTINAVTVDYVTVYNNSGSAALIRFAHVSQ